MLDGPAWFKVEEYDFNLSAGGWYRALVTRTNFQGDLDWHHRRNINAFDRNAFWAEFLTAIADPEFHAQHPRSVAPIEQIPASYFKQLEESEEVAPWELNVDERVLLSIDLEASDTTLQGAFSIWLARIRSERPLPIKRPGHPSETPNVELTPAHYAKWARYKILAVFDLDFWASNFDEDRLTHADLCDLLQADFPLSSDPKDWGREARRTLLEAMSCIDMLAYQATEGGDN